MSVTALIASKIRWDMTFHRENEGLEGTPNNDEIQLPMLKNRCQHGNFCMIFSG